MSTQTSNGLLSMLHRLKSSESGFRESLENACDDLGMARAQVISPVCLAYALLRSGAQPEVVSRVLSWRDFEGLVGALLRAAGFEVRENLVLTKPRAQVDVVGYGISMVLSIDCKHYRREQGPSKLVKFARDQLRRSSLLRVKSKDPRPIASVILTMSEPEGKFVEGVAVVPIRTFRSFLTTIDSNLDLLELR